MYDEFTKVLSRPRLEKYKVACQQNMRKALKLYRANIRISQQFYAIIGIFEVALRNAIDLHFTGLKGAEWLAKAIEPGTGYLDNPGCENSYHNVQESIQKLGTRYTHDALLSSLTFGFWTYQFGKFEFPASGNTLLTIFVNRPAGMKQKDILGCLLKVNLFRNRIAHHEPLCFDQQTGHISTALVLKRYALIKDLLHWLGYDTEKLFYGIDGVIKEVRFINRL